MDRAPLRELIKRTDERPEGTILLKPAIKNSKNTVATYFFTPSIREYFERVFEDAALGRGGGYWVQAEYGAGKTHFLSTLTSLLVDSSESLWNSLGKEEIKAYRRRLEGKRLFPVVLSLKGEADVTGRDNILSVIEEYTKEVLDEKGLSGKVSITADDEIIEWYKGCSSDLQSSIGSFIRSKLNQNPENLGDKSLAEAISKYCEENRIKPEITTSTRKRINHIYQQLIESGYSGILFVIDEFEAWQRRHPLDSSEYAQDEEVLETIGWILPKDMGLEVYTILASQAPAPAKLRGERFATFLLLADKNERDYDVIAAHRVRKLEKEKQPEIEKYYEYYYKEFKFLKNPKMSSIKKGQTFSR